MEGVAKTPQPAQQFSSGPEAPNLNISNLAKAKTFLRLSPQEENLYYHHLQNLHGTGKVILENGDVSTVNSITEGIGGRHYTIPTVWGGKILEPDEAIRRAQQVGLDQFPSYATPEEAMTRYNQIHPYMEQDLKDYWAREGWATQEDR